MDLTVPRYIVTIAEERGLAKAAEKLNVTSSALSQCIRKLESELGIPLFEKISSRTFKLTVGGKIYVDAARRALKAKNEAYRELEDVQNSNRGSFVFGCSPKRGLSMLSNVFPTFHKAYPNVQIVLKEEYLNELLELVIDGSVDIAVLTPLSEDHKDVHLEFLDREEIVLGIPLDHPLSHLADNDATGTITLADLLLFKHDKWMMTNHESMLRNLTDALFAEAGFVPQHVLLETSSTNPHVAAIEEGIAVSLIPLPSPAIRSKMRILRLEPRQFRSLYAAYRKSYLLSEHQRFFIDLMREFYESARTDTLPSYRLGW